MIRIILAMLALAASGLAANSNEPPKPEPMVVRALNVRGVVVACVDCDEPFDPGTHERLLDGLVGNPYVAELRRALYWQDFVHQIASKAHFDNCDFDGSIDYIHELMNDARLHVEAAIAAKTAANEKAMQEAVRRAFFSLGQVLHGVQDFYAHTNYVELMAPKVAKVTDIALVMPWNEAARARINGLRTEGLISGVVFWGFPKKCPAGTASHGELAKDSETTASGKKLIPHLSNISQYRTAVFLARESSLALLRDAFKRWPLLKEVNGANVAFDVILDRRGWQ